MCWGVNCGGSEVGGDGQADTRCTACDEDASGTCHVKLYPAICWKEGECLFIVIGIDVDIVWKCLSSSYLLHCGDGGFPILYVFRVSINDDFLMSIL